MSAFLAQQLARALFVRLFMQETSCPTKEESTKYLSEWAYDLELAKAAYGQDNKEA